MERYMFEQAFTQILRDYKDTLGDRKRFTGLLKDLMPGQPLQVNLLQTLYDMDIHKEIEKAAQITNPFAFRFVKMLCDEYGVSRSNADWVVSVWCVCYGRDVLKKPCEITIGDMKPSGKPAIRDEAKIKTQYQDLFCFSNDADASGLAITGFTGENSRTLILPAFHHDRAVTGIAENAFLKFDVNEVVMTDGIQVIAENAFRECAQLKQVIFPDSLVKISHHAFYRCAALTTALLPQKLEEIGDGTFAYSGVKSPVFPESLRRLGAEAYAFCENVREIKIPESVAILLDGVFKGCVSLKKAILHNNLHKIGGEAFAGCPNLKTLYVPESVEDIGAGAFDGAGKGFTLICERGSFAELYARTGGIKYQFA